MIFVTDQHPGRCLNHRLINGKNVRCLDYENIQHICTFPEVKVIPTTYDSYTYVAPTPKPWVRP